MFRRIATLWAYKKAPKKTYFARHPVKATKLWLMARGLKASFGRRARLALGALAVLPVGVWMAVRRSA